jgi:hypothetical protein
MRRFIRCLIYSVACITVVAGIVGFVGRAPVSLLTGGLLGGAAGGRAPGVVTGRPSPGDGQGHGQGNGHGHGNCRPTHVFVPGPGFKPLRATNAELIAHGFPPRPPRSDKLALHLWQHVVSRARRFDRPHPVCGSKARSTIYSGNWSGRVVPEASNGGKSITAVQSEWVQPAVSGNPSYTNVNSAPTVSIWTGVGVRFLMQAGVDSISTARPKYRFWTEDYPQKMIWEGPAIRPGQVAFVYIRNAGRHQATYFLENVTTGTYSSFSNPLPYVGIRAANFVLERPNGRYLPPFGSLNVWDDYFWQRDMLSALTSASNRWIMTSNCGAGGTVLARASRVSGGQFRQYWVHSRPFSNVC